LQRKVIQQQCELENFARVLAHDLKAPAGSIVTFATRIGERLQEGNSGEALQYADWVIQTAQRMSRLIDTLHRYTLADAEVTFETVDMNQVLNDVLGNLQHLLQESGASIIADNLPSVYGNAPQLIQLLQNLIGNGLKYCDNPVPSVHVAVSKSVASGSDESSWLFSVSDNGIGIPEAYYKRVFEPFVRVKSGKARDGTGLGLATCKKIVGRHRGAIWCQSQPGSGTTFFFTLQEVSSQPDCIPNLELPPDSSINSRA
jgi:light-regulated signal transduction histidine kinase (bacteriophytochrome)